MRDQAVHDLRVDEWDKRVVIPMQNQCRLPEFAEPGDAGPTHYSQQLIEVAERAAKVCGVCELVREFGLCAHLSPVDFSGDLLHIDWVLIASWRGDLRQDRETAGDHECPRSRADQDQPPTAIRVLKSKLLGKP